MGYGLWLPVMRRESFCRDLDPSVAEAKVPVDAGSCNRFSSRQRLALPVRRDHLLTNTEHFCCFHIGHIVLGYVSIDPLTDVFPKFWIDLRPLRHRGQF